MLEDVPVNIGDVVDKYRVERIVGVGAMGFVVAARHTTLDQVVAIKFLVEHRFGSRDESMARFLAEARAAARIESDHVCRVSDVGMLPTGIPYMVMEHLEGTDLEEEIVSRGQLAIIEAVDYVLQALDAIAAAHQLGIVHRDLKPANLFLARRPDGSRRVKVLDFGISKATANGQPRLTRATRSLGTPAYMPPEQIREPLNVDHRVDIWALGAILYELLTGQMAFTGENVKIVLDRVLGEDPCPIGALRRDVPPALVGIISTALMRDRDARWPTAATFARALAPFGSVPVVSGLACIQREVGALSMVPPAPSVPRVTPPSVEPMVSNVPREHPTQPDPFELNRRHHVAQDWAAMQARKRNARAVLLGMTAALLFASAVMVIVYRVAAPRLLRGSATVAASPAPTASPRDTAESEPPLPVVASAPGPVVPALPGATFPPQTAPAGSFKPASLPVHPAASSVYPARSSPAKQAPRQ